MQTFTATYSPEDNKLRLYSSTRLDSETYKRVRAAGFIWAPRQELFVAPMWTPSREDLLIELCGEIGDEDTTLADRAEQRAERFEEYKENRIDDAQRADAVVKSITEFIPLGQPILIGHHSERRARKDAEKIQTGMRKVVRLWDTADYWQSRAAGALRHAKYKELPGVRHRRIKGLEADLRRCENSYTPDPKTTPQVWDGEEHVWIKNGTRSGRWVKTSQLAGLEAGYQRWIAHLKNRIAYERAMLGEQGGMASDRFNIAVGGTVLVGGYWLTVLRVNKGANGEVNSLTTSPLPGIPGRVHSTSAFFKIESVKDYRAPEPGDVEKAKAAKKLPPLCNYPGEAFASMTQAEWDRKHKDYKTTRKIEATATHGLHRVRYAFVSGGNYKYIFITDAKRVDPPALTPDTQPAPQIVAEPAEPAAQVDSLDINPDIEASRKIYAASPDDSRIPSYSERQQMVKAAKQGVSVVVAPQLIPTPMDDAHRMAALAQIEPTDRVLEPNAGSGNILRAIGDAPEKVAVEISGHCIEHLTRAGFSGLRIHHADFLECTVNELGGLFDCILMNPPFDNGIDIKHIRHALTFLKPGGRFVAICANGPRQNAQLKPIVEQHGGTWEPLSPYTFQPQGVNVNSVLFWFATPAPPTADGQRLVDDDPETRLRAYWDTKGIPVEQQDAIIADAVSKAQPPMKSKYLGL